VDVLDMRTNGSQSGWLATSSNGIVQWEPPAAGTGGGISTVVVNTFNGLTNSVSTVGSTSTINIGQTNLPLASINPLASTNTGDYFFYSGWGTGTVTNLDIVRFGFDGTNDAFHIQGNYAGNGTHTNITAWNQGYNIPVIQAGATNVTLVAATTQAILFLHPMPSTNYTPFVTALGTTPLVSFSASVITTNGFTANFTALTLTGILRWTVTGITQ